ncbi:MAG: isopenicillin N synthase family oxygenase [Zavarzinia sp.]|nr:isopenicillin N synthase family oxygenase [Zavarzinia sp.]
MLDLSVSPHGGLFRNKVTTVTAKAQLEAAGLSARESDFSEIPQIDLGPMAGDDPVAKQATAKALRDACVNVGFFYIRNHGLPQKVIDDTFALCPGFFGLPLEEKMKIHVKKSVNNSGYTPLLEENTDETALGDLHEGFDIANELAADDPLARGREALYGPNQWPENLPGFKEQMLTYFEEVKALGRRLFRAFALALDLPEDYFDPMVTKPTGVLRILSYPSQDGPIDQRQIGIGAHTDYECFTILGQQLGVQALQVQNGKGEWVSAPPIPGTFVVNIGDQMARWTNDVFASTRHRALNLSGKPRYSMPFFLGTNYDTLIEALPSCVGPDLPAKYPPVVAGEYVLSRFDATYAYRQEPKAD